MSKIRAIYHVTDLDCWQRLEEVSALENSFMNELPVHAKQIIVSPHTVYGLARRNLGAWNQEQFVTCGAHPDMFTYSLQFLEFQ